MNKALGVWWDRRLVGVLRVDEHGDLGFAYDDSWIADAARPAISFSLPKRGGPFNRRQARPFFAGLLPEEAQRDAVARALGISKANDFRLLEALGGDVAGALTLWPQGIVPRFLEGLAAAKPLSDEALVEVLDALPTRPFLAGREGMRLSLAGAQKKLPVVLVNGRVALPTPGQPTTHILKPPIDRFPATTENEAFAMRLAAAIGLPVAPVEPREVAGHRFLLVERYDREAGADSKVRRLHQEDICQALGLPPEHKYAGEGGPTFAASFDLVRKACSRPAWAVLQLLDAAIFNLIIGNADAHGKNFSLLHTPAGVALAPLYDLMCTVAYPEISTKMAMKIAKRATLDEFKADTWSAFAADIGMAAPFVRRRVGELAGEAAAKAKAVADQIAAEGFDGEALASYAAIVGWRAETLTR